MIYKPEAGLPSSNVRLLILLPGTSEHPTTSVFKQDKDKIFRKPSRAHKIIADVLK